MNSFLNIDIAYIRASRTIETVLVSNTETKKMFYVYNYEGYSFRIFDTILSLIRFFETNVESNWHFETENQLDEFFSTIEL